MLHLADKFAGVMNVNKRLAEENSNLIKKLKKAEANAHELNGIINKLGEALAIQEKLEANNDYTRDIKNGLRDDITRIEKVADRVEDDVNKLEDKVRTMIDDAEVRFETRREQLRSSQKADMKELEDRLNAKVQRALDNPLAD